LVLFFQGPHLVKHAAVDGQVGDFNRYGPITSDIIIGFRTPGPIRADRSVAITVSVSVAVAVAVAGSAAIIAPCIYPGVIPSGVGRV
jgi:hypothetical protein